jgi:ATP/ADP translocase
MAERELPEERPVPRLVLAALPAALLGTSLGLGKIVRDCSLTCNVGYDLAPFAILAIAVLALPLSAVRVRWERRFGTHAWQLGCTLLAALSFLAFRGLTFVLFQGQQAAEQAERDPSSWILALRLAYLAFYVWVGVVTAFLGANAFGHVFRLFRGEERERGFIAVGIGIVVGGMAGSTVAKVLASVSFSIMDWRFELVRDNLMVPMALALLLQLPVILAIERLGGREAPDASAPARRTARLSVVLREVVEHPGLGRLAALILIGGVADTILKYLFYWLVSEQTTPTNGRTLYFANFYLWLNGASLLMLAFGSSRLIQRFGVGLALLSLPAAASLGAASLAFSTVLAVMYVLKIVESALHNTLYEPGIDRLYLLVPEHRAAEARALLNGLISRVGEGAGAILVLALSFGLGIGLRAMTLVLLSVLLAWVAAAVSVRTGLPARAAA